MYRKKKSLARKARVGKSTLNGLIRFFFYLSLDGSTNHLINNVILELMLKDERHSQY